MSMKKLSAALALAFTTTAAAADYQGEVGVAYHDFDGAEALEFSGEYHFQPVSTASHPLAEAAFLERSNNVSLRHTRREAGPTDTNSTTAQVEFYIPQAMLYVAPIYTHQSSKSGGFSSSDNDWGVTIGVTPMEGFRVTTTYFDDADYELNLEAKYVLGLANDTAVNMEFGYADAPDSGMSDTVSAAADYYFDRTFSVGAHIVDAEDTFYGVRTRKFFTETFSALAEITKADDDTHWKIGASLRF